MMLPERHRRMIASMVLCRASLSIVILAASACTDPPPETTSDDTATGTATEGPTSSSGPPPGTDDAPPATDDGTADSTGAPPTTDSEGSSGEPTLGCTLAWSSGFEMGFPGEWLDYDNGSWSPDGTMPPGRVSAWTIVDDASGEPVFEGTHAYRGWIEGSAPDSHRAYPGIHTDIPTPMVNTFMVWLDADYDMMAPEEWIHFGTWGNDDIMGSGVWALHTMSVRDRHLEFAHTEPFLGEYIGPEPAPEFPLGQWVRFTVYIHYQGDTGFVQVWQDGVPMLRAEVIQLATYPGMDLRTAHWGMYASGSLDHGTQYNDDIRIWTLDAPLEDLETEPDCWLGT